MKNNLKYNDLMKNKHEKSGVVISDAALFDLSLSYHPHIRHNRTVEHFQP